MPGRLSRREWLHLAASSAAALALPSLAMRRLVAGLRGRLACVVLALICLALVTHLREDSRRQLGERFSAALEAPWDEPVDAYFAPEAGVFLQGATTPVLAPALRDYVRMLKGQGQFFHRVSRVYMTPAGFGWLLVIQKAANMSADDNTRVLPPGLWLQGTIENDRITRVWIHFTVEALQATGRPVEAYRASMATRQMPLPAAWEDGTPALLAAAERVDEQADNDPGTASRVSGVGALLAGTLLALFAIRARQIVRRNRVTTGQLQDGRMLLELGRVRRGAVLSQGSHEPQCGRGAPAIPGGAAASAQSKRR
jgi:hypothetical protein